MTDASEGREEPEERDAGQREPAVDIETEPPTDHDAEPAGEYEAAAVDFENLTLPQRIFVAAVQNPTRGVLVALLLLFGLGFYVAFWFAFPRVAALLSAAAVVVGGVIAAVLVLLK